MKPYQQKSPSQSPNSFDGLIPPNLQQNQLSPIIDSSAFILICNTLMITLLGVLIWAITPNDLLSFGLIALIIAILCTFNWLRSLKFKSGKKYISSKLYRYAWQQLTLLSSISIFWGVAGLLIIPTQALHSIYLVTLFGLVICMLPLIFISRAAYLLQLTLILLSMLGSSLVASPELLNQNSLHYFLPLSSILLVVLVMIGSNVLVQYIDGLLAEHAHLLEAKVSIDDLTGLSHHNYFERALKREWRNSIRHHQELSLLVIFIDHFDENAISQEGYYRNENWEKTVAQEMRGMFKRASDVMARYKEGVFTVLLPETTSTSSYEIAERLRDRIQTRKMMMLGQQQSETITVSIAVGSFDPALEANYRFPGSLMSDLMELLDQHSQTPDKVWTLKETVVSNDDPMIEAALLAK